MPVTIQFHNCSLTEKNLECHIIVYPENAVGYDKFEAIVERQESDSFTNPTMSVLV
jgi:hypothetical protein